MVAYCRRSIRKYVFLPGTGAVVTGGVGGLHVFVVGCVGPQLGRHVPLNPGIWAGVKTRDLKSGVRGLLSFKLLPDLVIFDSAKRSTH